MNSSILMMTFPIFLEKISQSCSRKTTNQVTYVIDHRDLPFLVVKSHSSTIILWFSYGFRQLGKSSYGPWLRHGIPRLDALLVGFLQSLPILLSSEGCPVSQSMAWRLKGKSKPETRAFPMISMGCSYISFLKPISWNCHDGEAKNMDITLW